MQLENVQAAPEDDNEESIEDAIGDVSGIGVDTEFEMIGNAGGETMITDDMFLPDPPNQEEIEMDNMFDEMNYPTITEIENAARPEIGMSFGTREEAFHFFKLYARKMGFAVKKDTTYKSRIIGVVDKQAFVCNKSGKGILNADPGRKKRSNVIIRTECKVLVRVKLEENQWKVTAVHLEHNHELAPSAWLVRFMKCHKYMSSSEKRFIIVLQNNRVPPRKVMSIFRMLRGHLRAVGFDAKDINNLKSEESKRHRNKDIDELLELFKERQQKIPGFYYSLQTDEDNTVRSVFWTDAVGRPNYKVYGGLCVI